MAKKEFKSVDDYLESLAEDRRSALNIVRKTILQSIPKSIEEGIQYGMIGYYVPHSVYPNGYHGDPSQPLPYIALASQKNYMSLYLMGLYMNPDWRESFETAYRAAGRKLDMGACCVRFKRLEDLPLNVVGKAIKQVSLKKYIECYESSIATRSIRDKQRSRPSKTT
jgi:hypothetical protein